MSEKSTKINESNEEIDAEKLLECRKIVKNIIDFGVSESQKVQIIYLMSLELNNRNSLEMLTDTVKKLRSNSKEANFDLTKDALEYNSKDKPKLLDV
mgnify:CR=1 FL=1